MPIYKYTCTKSHIRESDVEEAGQAAAGETECGHEYEVFYTSQGAVEREEPSEACPKCGGLEKKRLVSTGTSHILKGNWFKQGY